jgi:hypothetical protein
MDMEHNQFSPDRVALKTPFSIPDRLTIPV